jgi:hypothetical protein
LIDDPLGPSGPEHHAAGVQNFIVRLLLVRLALACSKSRQPAVAGRIRSRNMILAGSLTITALVGLIGFTLVH